MAQDSATVDPLMHGLRSKGLKKGSVSLVGAVAIGLAATAPAYSLTGALGHGAEESGYQNLCHDVAFYEFIVDILERSRIKYFGQNSSRRSILWL